MRKKEKSKSMRWTKECKRKSDAIRIFLDYKDIVLDFPYYKRTKNQIIIDRKKLERLRNRIEEMNKQILIIGFMPKEIIFDGYGFQTVGFLNKLLEKRR